MPLFGKGQSGNPTGKPKEYEGITELAKRYAPRMIQVLNRIANDRKAPTAARVSAAALVLDRAYGKAPSFSTTDVSDFKRITELSDAELIAIAARGGINLEERKAA